MCNFRHAAFWSLCSPFYLQFYKTPGNCQPIWFCIEHGMNKHFSDVSRLKNLEEYGPSWKKTFYFYIRLEIYLSVGFWWNTIYNFIGQSFNLNSYNNYYNPVNDAWLHVLLWMDSRPEISKFASLSLATVNQILVICVTFLTMWHVKILFEVLFCYMIACHPNDELHWFYLT